MQTIAYITTGLDTGGAEVMLYHLLANINRQKFKPVVISLMSHGTFGKPLEALGIPVYTLGLKPSVVSPAAALTVMYKLLQVVNQVKPDIIQGWMYHGNIASNIAAFFAQIFQFRKIPVIWCIQHSINGLKLERPLTQFLIKLGVITSKWNYQVVFVSQQSKNQHESLGYFPNNTCTIPNAVDTSLFKPSSEAKLKFRLELGLSDNTFLIGLVCRYHPMKDHANFIKAAALLNQKYSDAHFIMVGTDVDNNNQALVKQIQDLGIVNQVHLLGERRDTNYLIPALDVLSISSAYGEASPLVLGEAMSSALPCVVTDIGDSGWMVSDTGKVVPPRNSEALAQAWQELIAMDSQARQALGKAARERAITCFSIKTIVEQYEKLYIDATTNKSTNNLVYSEKQLNY